MIIAIYLLAGALILLIIGQVSFYHYKRKKNLPHPLASMPGIGHEKIVETQLASLHAQLINQKDELAKILTNFKDQTHHQDKDFVAKLTTLATNLNNLNDNIKKQDSDLKTNLGAQNESVHEKFIALIKDLSALKETSKTLITLDQKVGDLQNIFLNSKKQGNLGEYMLETIVNSLYGTKHVWRRQYHLPAGGNVDVYIDFDDDREGIAIDAKFTLEKYKSSFENLNETNKEQFLTELKRDIKNKVNEVAKYINKKNKLSSAIMFIPSENVFSYIFEEFPDDIIDYSINKKVWIASPTTLAAMLFVISKHAQEIKTNKNIIKIKAAMDKLFGEFDRLNKRWEIFRHTIDKLPQQVEDLNYTHKQIFNKYEKIASSKEFETPTIDQEQSATISLPNTNN